jgi:hypothetical protein
MSADRIEVFADITCPFTHVGLRRVVDVAADRVVVVVRAWPLEWVNGEVMAGSAVQEKADVLCGQLGVELFDGVRGGVWPSTTIPAFALAAAGYAHGPATGLAVSLAVRDALFERGLDVADDGVLAAIAADHGVVHDVDTHIAAVRADYAEGQRRGVRGSPDFFVGDDEFFCPALDLGRDDEGGLIARFDQDGFDEFLDRVRAPD